MLFRTLGDRVGEAHCELPAGAFKDPRDMKTPIVAAFPMKGDPVCFGVHDSLLNFQSTTPTS